MEINYNYIEASLSSYIIVSVEDFDVCWGVESSEEAHLSYNNYSVYKLIILTILSNLERVEWSEVTIALFDVY